MSTEHKPIELKAYKYVASKQDIRRFLLDSDSQDHHSELIGKLVRAYKVEASSILIYWKDSEGDFVLIESGDDLQVALSAVNGALLKLFLTDSSGKHVTDVFGEATSVPSAARETDSAMRGGVHHPYVTCDGCNSSIFGRRFKCLECADYDLCESCEMVHNRHSEHNMVLIRRPSATGCPFMFGGRRRLPCGPQSFRGPHCGGFRCPRSQPQPQPHPNAEKPTAPQSADLEALQMRFSDMLREAQNGNLPNVIAAVNDVLRPFGADLSVLVEGAGAERRDSATATERNASASADSSEQAGAPTMGRSNDQSSEAKPSSSSTAVETEHAEKADKPMQNTESQPKPNATAKPTGRYASELQCLKDMGFDITGAWVEQLLVEKQGNLQQVLDILTCKQQF